MPFNKPARRVAVVGPAVIGESWAAYYLSRGFDVVDNAWPALTDAMLSNGSGPMGDQMSVVKEEV